MLQPTMGVETPPMSYCLEFVDALKNNVWSSTHCTSSDNAVRLSQPPAADLLGQH
jgi:hypothetical protein